MNQKRFSPRLKADRIGADAARDLAETAFGFLAEDPERLSRFASVTGFDIANARHAVAEPGFHAGVLGYLLSDEAVLLDCAGAVEVAPVSFALAYRAIPGGDPTLEISMEAFR